MLAAGVAVTFLAFNAVADGEPYAESPPFLVDTSTLRIDTDLDRLPDNYEVLVGLNPFLDDSTLDPDGDGLTNIEEYNSGTNPFGLDFPRRSEAVSGIFTFSAKLISFDTDGDGISDDWESAHGFNPFFSDAGQDADGDGLTNFDEYNAGTDPRSSDSPSTSTGISELFTSSTAIYAFALDIDTDADGMPDWWEHRHGLNPAAKDAGGDRDGDGVSNIAEFLVGRDPELNELSTEVAAVSTAFNLNTIGTRLDTDADGMLDAWELAHGLDQLRDDGNEDPDGDRRNNLDEYNSGTDPQIDDWRGPSSVVGPLFTVDTGGTKGPLSFDTDGDGIPDWWELRYGLNPLLSDAGADLDGDGFTNLDEYNSGGNPIVRDNPSVVGISTVFLVDTGGRFSDSDSDGLPDWWEKLYFNDARAANPVADVDGDGHSNYAEFIAGSNPLDANSVFKILGLQATFQTNRTHITIQWASFEGMTYSIWSATFAQGQGAMVASNIAATPPFNRFSASFSNTNGFFRLGVGR
jgi:hypothetical protein